MKYEVLEQMNLIGNLSIGPMPIIVVKDAIQNKRYVLFESGKIFSNIAILEKMLLEGPEWVFPNGLSNHEYYLNFENEKDRKVTTFKVLNNKNNLSSDFKKILSFLKENKYHNLKHWWGPSQ